jgi:hypothetical protein
MVLLLVAALVSVGVVVPTHTDAASAAAQPFPGPCPGGIAACVQVTLPCQTSPCPSVVAGPTDALVSDQYVYMAMSNFPAGDAVRIAYCTTDGSGTIVPDPYCATNVQGIALSKQFVVTNASGSAVASAPVAYDPQGQDSPPLPAVPLVQDGDPASSFFCDNGPDFCALEITDDGAIGIGPTDTTDNTMIIPLDFSPGASACPTSDPNVFSDSSFTVEHLITAVNQETCAGKNGVVALDTATNTATEMSDLATGGTPIAFTDDPSDPQLQAILPSTGFAYIPVALSATVVSFLATAPDEDKPGVDFPVSQYNLTPNMATGVLTTSYAGGGTADDLVTAPPGGTPPLNCAQLVGCNKQTTAQFNTFYLLNPEPAGVGQPGAIGSFFSNNVSGTNYQLSDWLCSAPNSPFQLTLQMVGSGQQTVSVTDTYNTASGTFTTPPTQSPFWNINTPASEWPFKTCAATSQFPSLDPGGLSQYNPSDTPALQAKSIRAYGSGGNLGFGAMDWSEASFNGLSVAALQNAAGNFVSPSAASLNAALSDAVENANGTLSFDHGDTSNTTAYPMPMVTYAVVPTTTVPAAQGQALTDLLTNMVDVSSGKTGSLPGGYVPLPSALASQALTDIANDIVTPGTKSSSASTSSGSSGSPSTGAGSGSAGGTGGGTGAGSRLSNNLGATYNVGATATPSASGPSGSPPSTRADGSPTVGGGTVATAGLAVLIAGTRYVLPVLIVIAIVTLIAGPVLLALPPRRRLSTATAPVDEPEGDSP